MPAALSSSCGGLAPAIMPNQWRSACTACKETGRQAGSPREKGKADRRLKQENWAPASHSDFPSSSRALSNHRPNR